MNKEQLRQYRHLNHEVNLIQEQINNIKYECAVVTASDREFPYCQHAEIVGGVPSTSGQMKRWKLEQRKARIQKRLDQVEQFIYHVDDSLIRQLLIYRYMKGLKWNEIAARMGGGCTADSLRMALERFLQKR